MSPAPLQIYKDPGMKRKIDAIHSIIAEYFSYFAVIKNAVSFSHILSILC